MRRFPYLLLYLLDNEKSTVLLKISKVFKKMATVHGKLSVDLLNVSVENVNWSRFLRNVFRERLPNYRNRSKAA